MDKTTIVIEIELNSTGGSGVHYAADIVNAIERVFPPYIAERILNVVKQIARYVDKETECTCPSSDTTHTPPCIYCIDRWKTKCAYAPSPQDIYRETLRE